MTIHSSGFSKAVLDGLDARSRELEAKWGIGRLRLLVDDSLRARFDQQQLLLRDALAADDEDQIILHASAMKRGWDALDAAATEVGAEELHPLVWEIELPDSHEIISIVRSEAEARHVCRAGEVWTLCEVATLIERFGKDVRQVKKLYPGAIVTDIRDKPTPSETPPLDDTKLVLGEFAERYGASP